MKQSDAERAFADAWDEHGLEGSDISAQYRFDKKRRWKFDFAFPSQMVAIEIQGMGRSGPVMCYPCKTPCRCPKCGKVALGLQAGGHQTAKGMRNDCEKHNAAVAQGWRILTFTTADFSPVTWVETVNELLANLPAD